ncbi:MAG: hypothetical protein HFG41_12030 [Coprococcus sp.]|nr:hypothetical protein [Coprococcus sp.]
MKQFLKKLGFHSPDEMEKAILFKAQRNAYFFLTAALFFWSLYESCQVYIYHNQLNPFPCFLLVTSVIIQTFSQLIMTRNAVKDDTDSFETGPLVKIIVLICLIISIIATIISAVVLMGVRI